MTGRCKSVASHSTVIFFFIRSLSKRREAYNNISTTKSFISENVIATHSAGYSAVNDYSTNEISNVCSFSSGAVDRNTIVSQHLQYLFCSVNNRCDYFTWNKIFVSSYGGR